MLVAPPADLNCPLQAPTALPAEPAGPLPDGPRPGGEVLIDVAGPRVAALPVYHTASLPGALATVAVRAGVALRLTAAAAQLPAGIDLVVLDGWRPAAVQRHLHAAAYGSGSALEPGYVAEPSEEWQRPPPHQTGGAIDVTLSWDGVPLALGTGFDDFTAAAAAAAFEETPGQIRDLRRLLRRVMNDAGFVGHPLEWWHFEWGTRRWAALTAGAVVYGVSNGL